MPYKKPKIEKIYYSIREAADMFGVKISTVRYWENEFDILKPLKNKKGDRHFTKTDIDNLHLIYHLLKEKGMTMQGVQKKLRENKEQTINTFEIIKRLQQIRSELIDIRDALQDSPLEKSDV